MKEKKIVFFFLILVVAFVIYLPLSPHKALALRASAIFLNFFSLFSLFSSLFSLLSSLFSLLFLLSVRLSHEKKKRKKKKRIRLGRRERERERALWSRWLVRTRRGHAERRCSQEDSSTLSGDRARGLDLRLSWLRRNKGNREARAAFTSK